MKSDIQQLFEESFEANFGTIPVIDLPVIRNDDYLEYLGCDDNLTTSMGVVIEYFIHAFQYCGECEGTTGEIIADTREPNIDVQILCVFDADGSTLNFGKSGNLFIAEIIKSKIKI